MNGTLGVTWYTMCNSTLTNTFDFETECEKISCVTVFIIPPLTRTAT